MIRLITSDGPLTFWYEANAPDGAVRFDTEEAARTALDGGWWRKNRDVQGHNAGAPMTDGEAWYAVAVTNRNTSSGFQDFYAVLTKDGWAVVSPTHYVSNGQRHPVR